MQHLHGVLFVLYAQTELETAVRPDLFIHDTCRFLGCQNQMYTQASAYSCQCNQVLHEIRMVLLQFSKFIHDYDQFGKIRQTAVLIPYFLVLVYIHDCRLMVFSERREEFFPSAAFILERDQCPFDDGIIQVGQYTADMRQTVHPSGKHTGSAPAFEIDHSKLQFPGTVENRQR